MNKHHLLLAPLILGISTEICAEDYFDPSLLASDVSGAADIDLSAFSRPGGGLEGEQEVSIYINDEFYSRKTLSFKNTADKGLLPEFPTGFFDDLISGDYLSSGKNGKLSEGKLSSETFMANVPYSDVVFD